MISSRLWSLIFELQTCIIVTVGSIFGGRGMWIWYLEKFSSIFGLTRRQNTTRPLFVLDYLLVPVHPDPHAFLDVCRGDAVGKIHDKLGELLHIDDVLGIIRVGVDDLCASRDLATDRLNLHRRRSIQFSHLQRLLRLEALLVSCEIPQGGRGKSSVGLLQMRFFVQLFWHFASAYCYEWAP